MLSPTTLRQLGSGARTLYLGAQGKKHIGCTEEALVVHNEARQTMRYPIARISRIVSSPSADWSGPALALCMQSGIAISWVGGKGQALGSCLPHTRHYTNAATAVEQLTETEAGHQRYQTWLRQRRMDILVRWGHAQTEQLPPAVWETAKREWVYGARVLAVLPDALLGHCNAYVLQQISEHTLPPQLWGPKAQPIALDHDLTHLIWGEMNLTSGNLASQTQEHAPLTKLFEHWLGHHPGVVGTHIQSLQRAALKHQHHPQSEHT